MKKRLFLLDGHSLAHRAFYALPLLTNSDGEYTNAIFGFTKMLFKLIDNEDPDLMAVAFDLKAPTFRHKEFDDYKAGRKKMPDELSPQIPQIKSMLEYLNIPTFELEGYEADDVIGTLAREGEREDYDVVIVTGDRDALQLVTDNVNIMYTKRGITNIVNYDLDKVHEKYELEPAQLVDMKGLMGDSSDNIPGVPGIGEKTATKLLKQFADLDEILDNIDKVSGKKRKENLHKFEEQARMSKRLGEIMVDVPIDIDIEELKMEELTPEEKKKIVELFRRYEFNSLLERFQDIEEINPDDIEISQLESSEEIKDLINEIKEAGEISLSFVLDDFEHPVKSEFSKLVISTDEITTYEIPAEKELLEHLKPVLEDEDVEKLMVNAKENMIAARRSNIEIKGLTFEPLLARYLLHPSESLKSLEDILKEKFAFELSDQLDKNEEYAYKLTKLFELKELLLSDLKEKELFELYNDIEIPLIPSLAEMELNGINVDQSYLKELSERWKEKVDEIVKQAHDLAGEEFNLNSPKQVGEILFEKLGLPVIKKTKTGYSTSISVLEKLEGKHEIIPLIMEYRKWSKLRSTYVDALPPLINEETGRIHTSYNQKKTATGRLSSTEPNLQNIPIRTKEGREVRKAFVPKNEDWTLLAADYSQVELRVLAHVSGDDELQHAFQEGLDIHTETASKIFEVDPEEVTSNMRRHAKVINFGIAYGMSAYGLSEDLDISRKEAEDYIEKYFDRFSGVDDYMDDVTEQAKEEGYVTTIFDRRRYIPDINSSNYHKRSFARRTAINTPIQGSAADIMKLAMIDVYDALQDSSVEANLLLQVHDELVLEVKNEDLEEAASLVKEKMEETVSIDVPLTVDLQVGDNWRDKEDFPIPKCL